MAIVVVKIKAIVIAGMMPVYLLIHQIINISINYIVQLYNNCNKYILKVLFFLFICFFNTLIKEINISIKIVSSFVCQLCFDIKNALL